MFDLYIPMVLKLETNIVIFFGPVRVVIGWEDKLICTLLLVRISYWLELVAR